MKLQANQKMIGDGYRVDRNDIFQVPDREAMDLLERGMARMPDAPRVEYQTKVIKPAAPEVAAGPFRNGNYADERSAPIHSSSGPMLPKSDPQKPRATRSR